MAPRATPVKATIPPIQLKPKISRDIPAPPLAEGVDDPALPELRVELEAVCDGAVDPCVGVKTPPEGTWFKHDEAALAASAAVLGPKISIEAILSLSQIQLEWDNSRFLTKVAFPPKSQLVSTGLIP
jgi:hypothetical protein